MQVILFGSCQRPVAICKTRFDINDLCKIYFLVDVKDQYPHFVYSSTQFYSIPVKSWAQLAKLQKMTEDKNIELRALRCPRKAIPGAFLKFKFCISFSLKHMNSRGVRFQHCYI